MTDTQNDPLKGFFNTLFTFDIDDYIPIASFPPFENSRNVEVAPEGGVSKQKADETGTALRELGLSDNLKSE